MILFVNYYLSFFNNKLFFFEKSEQSTAPLPQAKMAPLAGSEAAACTVGDITPSAACGRLSEGVMSAAVGIMRSECEQIIPGTARWRGLPLPKNRFAWIVCRIIK